MSATCISHAASRRGKLLSSFIGVIFQHRGTVTAFTSPLVCAPLVAYMTDFHEMWYKRRHMSQKTRNNKFISKLWLLSRRRKWLFWQHYSIV